MEDSVFVVQSVLMGFYFNIFWQFTFKIVKHDSYLYLWYALQLESKPRILYKHTHTRADSHAHSPLAQLFRFIPVALRYGGKKFVQLSA